MSFSGYKSGYGNVVEITHPTGYVTRYGHNSRNLVRVGQMVQKDTPIAVIGSTGRSTGTHVHFEVRARRQRAQPEEIPRVALTRRAVTCSRRPGP